MALTTSIAPVAARAASGGRRSCCRLVTTTTGASPFHSSLQQQGTPPPQQQQWRRTIYNSTSVTTPVAVPAAAANATQHPDAYNKTAEELRLMSRTLDESIYALGKHRSNALELVHQYPVIEVDGDMAICDGGGGALGHPLEYISLARGGIEYCKYCSLRYQKKAGSHGDHH